MTIWTRILWTIAAWLMWALVGAGLASVAHKWTPKKVVCEDDKSYPCLTVSCTAKLISEACMTNYIHSPVVKAWIIESKHYMATKEKATK
jgi:hypothetical protein